MRLARGRSGRSLHDVSAIASVIKMPFNRMRHVVVIDQSIDDRVRAATDGKLVGGCPPRDCALDCISRAACNCCQVQILDALLAQRRRLPSTVYAVWRLGSQILDRSKARQPRCGEGALVVAGRRLVVAVFKPGRCEWCATAVSSPLQTRSLRGLRKPMRGTQSITVEHIRSVRVSRLRSPPCRDVRIVLVEMNYYRHRHRYGRPATVVVVCNGIRVTRGWFGRACNDASRACVESRMCSTKLGLGSCEAYDSGKRLVASQ